MGEAHRVEMGLWQDLTQQGSLQVGTDVQDVRRRPVDQLGNGLTRSSKRRPWYRRYACASSRSGGVSTVKSSFMPIQKGHRRRFNASARDARAAGGRHAHNLRVRAQIEAARPARAFRAASPAVSGPFAARSALVRSPARRGRREAVRTAPRACQRQCRSCLQAVARLFDAPAVAHLPELEDSAAAPRY